MSPGPLPRRTRDYVSYIFDSRNWDAFRPRPGDVVIATSYKSGTTWMQNILRQLVFPEPPRPPVGEVSPWVDRRCDDPAALHAALEAQTHRRFLKSHLPLDALPWFPEVRYVVAMRDPRDVFMSFWNHYSGFTDAWHARPQPAGVTPMPRCPADLHALWPRWISEGWFPWESDGWPHSGNLYHAASWWRFRHLPNLHLVHFQDLLDDLDGEIARLAAFLDLPLAPDRRAAIAAATSFTALRADRTAGPMAEDRALATWRDGLATFFHKGTNGRWRGVLTEDELALYEAAKARCLPPDCAAFLELGRKALTPPARVAEAAAGR
ncbi:sulfotransferase domain-containing protein [Amaricoccus sp.]|uniref:sulfotransferase domain-containing protein n=1 Tax=Amaricoccus sp. TaxID=1872485 RepID=UPI001B5F04C6|nr:sulfotransferase domain-containing protein [Amaricoccus sp.]MBP7000189.1 sulfotransferase domain-containing protein [Amaricoccus sp.]